MIATGSSERGLSEVTTARSASSAADRAHQRPLLAVAVAAAAEDADQPPVRGGELAGRDEHVLERVRGVRVVDQDRERLALVDRLEPARHRLGVGECRGGVVEVDPERAAGGDRAERVRDVEPARAAAADLDAPVRRRADVNRDPEASKLDVEARAGRRARRRRPRR